MLIIWILPSEHRRKQGSNHERRDHSQTSDRRFITAQPAHELSVPNPSYPFREANCFGFSTVIATADTPFQA
jgi:hypothetical protein